MAAVRARTGPRSNMRWTRGAATLDSSRGGGLLGRSTASLIPAASGFALAYQMIQCRNIPLHGSKGMSTVESINSGGARPASLITADRSEASAF